MVYTGTHDNDTIEGYLKNAPKSERRFCIDYLRLSANEGYNWGMMRAAMATAADTCILQMQDFMGLSEGARINTPRHVRGKLAVAHGGQLYQFLACRHYPPKHGALPQTRQSKSLKFGVFNRFMHFAQDVDLIFRQDFWAFWLPFSDKTDKMNLAGNFQMSGVTGSSSRFSNRPTCQSPFFVSGGKNF